MSVVGPVIKAGLTPNVTYTFVAAPNGWQPWNITSTYQVSSWDYEYVNTGTSFVYSLVGNCIGKDAQGRTAYIKVYIPASSVTPSA